MSICVCVSGGGGRKYVWSVQKGRGSVNTWTIIHSCESVPLFIIIWVKNLFPEPQTKERAARPPQISVLPNPLLIVFFLSSSDFFFWLPSVEYSLWVDIVLPALSLIFSCNPCYVVSMKHPAIYKSEICSGLQLKKPFSCGSGPSDDGWRSVVQTLLHDALHTGPVHGAAPHSPGPGTLHPVPSWNVNEGWPAP